MLVPITKLNESVRLFENEFEIYPLWLCPFLLPNNPGMLHPSNGKEEMYVDIGVYGVPKSDNFHPKRSTRNVERFVTDVKGFVIFIFLKGSFICGSILLGIKCYMLTRI